MAVKRPIADLLPCESGAVGGIPALKIPACGGLAPAGMPARAFFMSAPSQTRNPSLSGPPIAWGQCPARCRLSAFPGTVSQSRQKGENGHAGTVR